MKHTIKRADGSTVTYRNTTNSREQCILGDKVANPKRWGLTVHKIIPDDEDDFDDEEDVISNEIDDDDDDDDAYTENAFGPPSTLTGLPQMIVNEDHDEDDEDALIPAVQWDRAIRNQK